MSRPKIVNPEGYWATQNLKERGWTPALISKFLGEHDLTRPNGLKMGGRRLPPVKLYLSQRVEELESQDVFLAAQAKAADARERAERARETRLAKRAALLAAAAASYVPVIQPQPLRKGATRKAREPYLKFLEQTQQRLERELGKVTEREAVQLQALLLEQLDIALAAVYDWFARPGEGKSRGKEARSKEAAREQAKPSDWRDWDWD